MTRLQLAPPSALLTGAALIGLLPGCFVFRAHFGEPLPADAVVAQLVPGVTSRAETVALLGPPEEYRTPRDFEAARSQDVRREMVWSERDLLDRRRLTWIDETRDSRGLWLVPGFSVFETWSTHFEVQRLVVFFDAEDRVETLAWDRVEPGR